MTIKTTYYYLGGLLMGCISTVIYLQLEFIAYLISCFVCNVMFWYLMDIMLEDHVEYYKCKVCGDYHKIEKSRRCTNEFY